MKIISLQDVQNLNQDICFPCGMISNRFLLKKDNMGFTVTLTEIPKGEERHWHYINHLEACYCISGHAILKDLDEYQEYLIKPGVLYALDKHDDHKFLALEDTVLLCVFNPPLIGNEIHKEDGTYEIKS
jgi:L-ectoine synthase